MSVQVPKPHRTAWASTRGRNAQVSPVRQEGQLSPLVCLSSTPLPVPVQSPSYGFTVRQPGGSDPPLPQRVLTPAQ